MLVDAIEVIYAEAVTVICEHSPHRKAAQELRRCQARIHQAIAPDQTPAIASHSPSVRKAIPKALRKIAVETLVNSGGFSTCERIDGIRAAAMKKLPAAISASCQLILTAPVWCVRGDANASASTGHTKRGPLSRPSPASRC